MGLHDSPLFQRKRTGFFEKPRREANLANVMNKPGKVSEVLFLLAQLEAFSNIAGVYGYSRRVTCGVAIAGVQGGDKRPGERQTCPLQSSIDTA
jgi:hypothetical protein